jgi:hypothetical protein
LLAYDDAESTFGPEPPSEGTAAREEWLQIQLDRLMALYVSNRTRELEELVKRVAPLVEQQGTAMQRGLLFQGLVLAAYRRDQYVVSDETLGHAEAAVDAFSNVGSPSDLCMAQFSLGFCHLWRDELSEAARLFHAGLALAERIGDAANRTLCLTYLTVLHRKRQDIAEVRRFVGLSRAAAETARMENYRAIAEANDAWVAWRDGDLPAALAIAQASLHSMQGWEVAYPFQWIALWPLIGAEIVSAATQQAIDHSRILLEKSQQPMPEPLRTNLLEAVQAWDAGAKDAVAKRLDEAVGHAKALGFL